MNSSAPFVSIIVPVLNEADLIDACLRNLRNLDANLEIIVVDGGSSDGTWSLAEPLADRVIRARRGRASQMNAGAEIARGEVLWFLHADLDVPTGAVAEIQSALTNPRIVGGCFRLRFPRHELIYRVSDSLGNVGVNLFGFALGDHGIFCQRVAFRQVGGYPEVPILEDAEIYRRLRREGRMVQLRAEMVSNPRAFEAHGRYRTTAVYFSILALYVLGVPIRVLNRIYRRFRGLSSPARETPAMAHAAIGPARFPQAASGSVVGKWCTRQGRQIPWLRFSAPALMTPLHNAQTSVGINTMAPTFSDWFELTAYPKIAPPAENVPEERNTGLEGLRPRSLARSAGAGRTGRRCQH